MNLIKYGYESGKYSSQFLLQKLIPAQICEVKET